MDFERSLAILFQEEDSAREMARHLMDVARQSREAASRERASLLRFLDGPLERHMAYEERKLFPQLEARGLAPEIGVARKHHVAIREAATALRNAPPDADVSQAIFDAARLMLHHTNFEGDYIYPELDRETWLELMEESIHD